MKNAYSYVRWSSAPQGEGSTEDRQTELAAKYASTHGLRLVDTFTDPGVSAFRGKNAKHGALRTFLDAVDAGAIPKGSFLLIEDLQRLSRMPARQAQRLLEDIVERGITVVTIKDGKHYDKDSLDDIFTLVMSLLRFDQTHKDSKHKGDMVKKGWDDARQNNVVFSKNCPSWLKPVRDANGKYTGFALIPEKVKVVERIFELARLNKGSHLIAKALNDEERPTLSTASSWESALVLHVLRNEAVIGNYVQRGWAKNPGAFRRDGYFPQVIKPKVFGDVQTLLTRRQKTGGGRSGSVSNLFSGLLYCPCGSKVRTVSGNRAHTYLRCRDAVAGKCDAPAHPAKELERGFLEWLAGHSKVLSTDQGVQADPTALIASRIAERETRLANLYELVATVGGAATSGGMAGAGKLIAELEADIQRLKVERQQVKHTPAVIESLTSAFELLDRHSGLQAVGGEELNRLRMSIQGTIRQLFTRINLLPDIEEEEALDGSHHKYGVAIAYGPLIDDIRNRTGAWSSFLVKRDLTKDGGSRVFYELDPAGRRVVKPRKHVPTDNS
jgi:DNA invertase Pin-like site-specific DNA recombinase